MPRPEILDTIAEEQGTYVLDLDFKDEDDLPVIPISINWTLTTLGGEVVNSRSEVDISPPASTVNVVLSGDDLQLLTHKTSYSWRLFTVKAVYNSDLAPGLPIHKAVRFKVRNLRLVAQALEISVSEGITTTENVGVSLS